MLRSLRSYLHPLLASPLLTSVVLLSSSAVSSPAWAVSRLNIRIGPLTQTVEVQDLESFAQTGEVPSRLKLYSPALTPEVRRLLQSRLAIDPDITDRVTEDILQSPNGELLLDTLAKVAPNLTMEQLQTAIRLAASQAEGMSLLGIVRAIPQETLEIDLTAAIALASQINLSRLESAALTSAVKYELMTEESAPPLSFDPSASGPQTVTEWSLVVRDQDRDRTIPVDIYWAEETRGPLVILSHGFGADRHFLAYLAQHLASHGITTVALEHPGSNVDALSRIPLDLSTGQTPSRILPATEFLDRPQDVSVVLDRLEELNRTSYTLRGKFNTDSVTLIGHSLGGYTGLALAGAQLDIRNLRQFCRALPPIGISPADWLQCAAVDLPQTQADLTDRRITQVIAMNPLIGELFGTAGLSQISVPTLLLGGTNDGVTPLVDQQLRPFTQLSGRKYFVAIVGGTHLSIGDPGNINPALSQIPFMPELRGEETANVRQFLKATALAFVLQDTPDADTYAPVLTPSYAQAFSTADLAIRFTTELPTSLDSWLRLTQNISGGHATPQNQLGSLIHLEMLGMRRHVHGMQRQFVAYLRSSHPSLAVLQIPVTWLYPPDLHIATDPAPSRGSDHPAK